MKVRTPRTPKKEQINCKNSPQQI